MNNKDILNKMFSDFIENNWKKKLFLIIFFGLITSFLIYLEPFIFIKIIKILEDFIKTGVFDKNLFIYSLVFWWIYIIISNVFMYTYRYNFVLKGCVKSYKNISKKYSKKIINMPFWSYLNKEVWAIYKIFDRWTLFHFDFFHSFFVDFIKTGWWIFFVVILLFYINPLMTFVTLWVVPIMSLLGYYFYKKLYPLQEKLDKQWESVFHDIWNSMSVFSLIKTLTIENIFLNKINKKLDKTAIDQIWVSKIWTIADVYVSLLVTISRFFVLIVWTYLIVKNKLDFTTVFLFFSYIWRVYFWLWALFSKISIFQKWITASGRFYKEFDSLENEHKNQKWIKKTLEWEIKFNNVTFWYNSKNVINNLNFDIKKWEKIAFVWNTWAWKSTIVNLFLKFWDIKKWEILIDWININKLNLKDFRKQIWVIGQDSSLFNLTIKENLLFANPKATNKEIEKSLKNAEADFVLKLPDWINTLIGERWLKLSWWEKQRLAIARLFLKNPKILVLDEATSALDNKTEKLVQKAFEKLMEWRTSIIIAHRLSTIKNVDNIYLLQNWEILERWKYNKLIENKSAFYNLANPDNLIIN